MAISICVTSAFTTEVNGIAGIKAMPEDDAGPETIQLNEWSKALPAPKSLKIVAACAILTEARQPLIAAAKHATRNRIGLLQITAATDGTLKLSRFQINRRLSPCHIATLGRAGKVPVFPFLLHQSKPNARRQGGQ